ncbi:phosphoribosylformylglycinamidine cyclo-ligase [bacterium]|nr:phosphoribosylformylglycinamidine cyclo-ligase [bacterium]
MLEKLLGNANRDDQSLTYAEAGVSIDAQDKAIDLLKPHARSTFRPEVLTDVGAFGAAFSASFENVDDPVLVSSTDGVGTKLKYAYRFGTHRNAGIDLVSTCVNDIICAGASPLFFLDYIGLNKVIPEVIEEIVSGISEGCRESGCALIGGEIAEMRDTYASGEYDLVGFATGVVARKKMLPRSDIAAGDQIIGISSSGIHCNGYSLARRVFAEIADEEWHKHDDELGCSLMSEVTRPARIYASEAKALFDGGNVKALVHISGGGLRDNIPRVIPQGLGAKIHRDKLAVPPIFKRIAHLGPVDEAEMFRTFNMGTGLAIIVSKEEVQAHLDLLKGFDAQVRVIGEIADGFGVELC